ncbi:hypothetical protein [Cognatilysobacter tabacisoli]|uniref:hypothetical protein n=1 Tax=Cognatilysobacter tabacisoli TaxID=2315424 RepID=UPI000E6B390D|nr:hypothetical protein [Lysobacter tabacisoli]
MSMSTTKAVALAVVSFAAGLGIANLPTASASAEPALDLSKRKFTVFIDEVKQNHVFGDTFSGSYSKTITLSDGSRREITLTPTAHKGMQLVELKDTGGLTYMSLSGTTTNGTLMIQVKDDEASKAALKAQGWKW